MSGLLGDGVLPAEHLGVACPRRRSTNYPIDNTGIFNGSAMVP
jgi:hypothetical protein